MRRLTWSLGRLIARTHAMFAITAVTTNRMVMASQVSYRHDFANNESYWITHSKSNCNTHHIANCKSHWITHSQPNCSTYRKPHCFPNWVPN